MYETVFHAVKGKFSHYEVRPIIVNKREPPGSIEAVDATAVAEVYPVTVCPMLSNIAFVFW